MTARSYFIIRENCIENKVEAKLYEKYLIENGYVKSATQKDADVIVVCTCGFEKAREEKWIRIIDEVKTLAKPDAEVLVCGCLPKISETRLKRHFSGTILGLYDQEAMKNALRLSQELDTSNPCVFQEKSARMFLLGANAAFRLYHNQICASKACIVKTAIGCLGQCAFCAIRRAKPKLLSTSPEIVVRGVTQAIQRGYRNIIFSADDFGAYGQDIGTNCVELLESIFCINERFMVEIRYMEPQWLGKYNESLLKVISRNKSRISFMCIPVQSGSNKILSLMNRLYTSEEYTRWIREIKKSAPPIFIRNHFIVGFPGETDDDFAATVRVLKEAYFDIGQIFMYTDRQGTSAEKMDGKVPAEIIKKRFDCLTAEMRKKTTARAFTKYFRYGHYRNF